MTKRLNNIANALTSFFEPTQLERLTNPPAFAAWAQAITFHCPSITNELGDKLQVTVFLYEDETEFDVEIKHPCSTLESTFRYNANKPAAQVNSAVTELFGRYTEFNS